LIKLFQKFAGSKGSALGRARRRETSLSPFFGSFCGNFAKKNGESFLT
jgi:hypothetical protein